MSAILKGISVIKSVKPKSNVISRTKASIAKTIGESSKINANTQELLEQLLEVEKKGGDIEKIKEVQKKLDDVRENKPKYPKKIGEIDEGLEFEKTSEYAKGGIVKKGFPKIAKKGWK